MILRSSVQRMSPVSQTTTRTFRTTRLPSPMNLSTPTSLNLSSGRHASPLSSSARARGMSLAMPAGQSSRASPGRSGPVADRNARHAERLRVISDRGSIPSRFAHSSQSSSAR